MAKVLYQGHGSLRLTTEGGKVIYIDPFAGDGYDKPGDLILVTHQHHDHNCVDLPARAAGCAVWQSFDALREGEYRTLETEFCTVEAVEAYNHHHRKEECVGYLVGVDGLTLYFAGDTGETEQMARLAEREIDYAFLPMDATYTMDVPETARCAGLIAARHTVPIHMAPGKLFDPERAGRLKVPGVLVIPAGEEITL